MSYSFTVAHSIAGRTRIRWAGDDSEKSTVKKLADNIEKLPGVGKATARITTGSIIIEYDEIKWPVLENQLTENLAIDFTIASPAPVRTGLETLNQGLDQVDRSLRTMNVDLGSLTVFLLLVMALTQALRGQVMVSSASFLWYALSVASKSRPSPERLVENGKASSDSLKSI